MIRALYNFCWYAVGGVILTAAILVTIVRLLLPDIGSYREEVQDWISHYMGYPVVIQSIRADWRGWEPQLYMDEVTLLNRSGDRAIAEFDSAHISFNPLQSLYYRQLIPDSLVFSGVRMQLKRLNDGTILAVYPGLHPDRYHEYMANDELIRWLLSQPSIELQDSRIDWIDDRDAHRPISLENANLQSRADGTRTQITGDARLARQLGKHIEFALDIEGDLLGDDWSGRIYMHGRGLLPASWPVHNRWAGIEIGAGRSDLRIWSDWRHAELTHLSGTVNASDVLILGNNRSNLVHSAAGSFEYKRMPAGDGWYLHSHIRELSTHNGTWPAAQWEFERDAERELVHGYGDFLRIEDLLPLLGTEAVAAYADSLFPGGGSIRGDMDSVQFSVSTARDLWRVNADFRGVRLANANNNQRVTGLTGDLEAHNGHGTVNLYSRAIDISWPDLFAQPLTGLSAEGRITWKLLEDGLSFRTDHLDLATPELQLQLSGKLGVNAQGGMAADLIARTRGGGELEPLKRYVPLAASEELRNWIDRAIVGGRLEYADMVLRGDLDRLPFRHQEGQLKVHARLDDLTLDYHPEWPPIYHLEAGLTLERDKLRGAIPAGRIYDAGIHNVSIFIDDVYEKDNVLTVTGDVEGHARDAMKFINESPLRDDVQIRRLRELETDGEIALSLDMLIPLSPAPNEVEGRLELLGNKIISPNPKLALADVKGTVNFTSSSMESEVLHGKYHGEIMDLGIRRTSDAPNEPTIMRMKGPVDSGLMPDIFAEYMPDHAGDLDFLFDRLSGRTIWDIEIRTRPEHPHVDSVALESDLRGLSIALPEPLGKPENEARTFGLNLSGAGGNTPPYRLRLWYGDTLQATAEHGRVGLYFGSDRPPRLDGPAQLVIHGSMPSLSIDSWISVFAGYRDRLEAWQKLVTDRTVEVDLGVGNLHVYNKHLPDSRLTLARQQDDWLFGIAGENVAGTVNIPGRMDKQPVNARFEKLHLKPLPTDTDADSETPDPDPRTLPAFNIDVEDFAYGNTALGSLKLESRKSPNGLLIREFSTRRPGLAIDGRGDWHAINNEIFSEFELELHAERFADMLTAFGYSVIAIEDGETNIEIEASWPGAPMDFSLAGMSGSLALNIQKGQFLDIDPRAGRLFGLLSIQALPRRLLLDFADLFKKGLAFDRINGTYEIKDGHAYTDDLLMEGISSKVAITGRTGLVDQDYDQIVTVTPHISDSLPFASALFGPAGIGVGAIILLAGQVFEAIPNQIDKLMRFQYTMTGSWQDPVIESYPARDRDRNKTPRELGAIE